MHSLPGRALRAAAWDAFDDLGGLAADAAAATAASVAVAAAVVVAAAAVELLLVASVSGLGVGTFPHSWDALIALAFDAPCHPHRGGCLAA